VIENHFTIDLDGNKLARGLAMTVGKRKLVGGN